MKAQSSTGNGTSNGQATTFGNIYLDALLWLTPTNPFGTIKSTTIDFSFGTAGDYTIYDPESTVPILRATNWNPSIGPQSSATLLNGDVIAFPNGWTGEKAATYVALSTWANVANVNLNYTAHTSDADFKFLVTDGGGMRDFWSGEPGVLGFSELPFNYGPNYGIDDSDYSPGYAVFNQDGYGWTKTGLLPGGYGYVTILHEIGHLFGLDHPWDEGGFYINRDGTRGAPEPYFPGVTGSNETGVNGLNQGVFTTMTYNDGWNGQPSNSPGWGYQMGPGAFDIAAMQKLYGANMAYHAGDDTYVLPGAKVTGTGWFTLWDARGNDTIKVPDGAGAAAIDLRAATLEAAGPGAGGFVSWVNGVAGGFTIAKGVVIENAVGAGGNDAIIGNEAKNQIAGGGGYDTLTGGGDSDTFVFTKITDALPKSNPETITDFTPGVDLIDLRLVDINSANGIQHFHHVNGDFTGVAGDLHFASGLLAGDVNGDQKADFEIKLSGVAALNWSHDVLLV